MTTTSNVPAYGRFGGFGGRYVPEALIPALEQLEEVWRKAVVDPEFGGELERLHRTYTGRPSTLLILCEPVWLRSSRLRMMRAPPACAANRGTSVMMLGRPV